ncbi:MAG: lysostaphin resistance A-like protein [Hyphomonadaceae bacterium]
MSMRTLCLFLASLLVVSWGVQFAALVIVGDVHSGAMTPWLLGLMFMPSLWAIGYLTLVNRKDWKRIQFWPGNPIYLVFAALIPAAIAFATLGVSLWQGWGGSSYFTFTADGAEVLRGPWVLGDGAQSWALFAANVAATALVFAGINGLAAVGEEFGWRGFLQHHTIQRLGFVRGVGILGLVWALWHAPMNFAGYNFPEAPALGALVLFPIELIAVSFVMAWLTIRARSFWPAVLMHGSGNGIEEGVMQSLTLNTHLAPLAAEFVQIAITVALGLIAIALWPRRAQASAQTPAPAAA